MKTLFSLSFLVALSFPSQVNAQYYQQVCYGKVYVPEGYDRYGNYHSGYYAEREVPCNVPQPRASCDPSRTFLGAILGGGVAASMSRGDGYKWSVPLGAFIGGAGLGCN